MVYKIYYANLGKATGIKEIGTRPIVSIKVEDDFVVVCKITSRMRPDFRHIKMNQYLISGFCDISQTYRIDRKFLGSYVRDCTTSEVQLINNGMKKFKNPD